MKKKSVKKIGLFSFFLLWATPVLAGIVYQDFEPNNGTPPSYYAAAGSDPEYGWGFNDAVVGLSSPGEMVHGGERSWKVIIPAGPQVHAGTGIPAQAHTYNVNFVPECHDRLTFWVWSDPSAVGDHTTMIKFFDQDKYKQEGIGVWTLDKAHYHQWTLLTILFSQLPSDFNVHRVDKIEFFNYWDGTYYYDDIQIGSSASSEQDFECLKKENFVSCLDLPPGTSQAKAAGGGSVILGMPEDPARQCMSVYDRNALLVLDFWQSRFAQRIEGRQFLQEQPYGRF